MLEAADGVFPEDVRPIKGFSHAAEVSPAWTVKIQMCFLS